MTEQEAIAYIEEWDVTEAAKVLKWYEEDELLRPCDCDTIVAIETENLQAENDMLRSQCTDLVDERERLFQANVEKNGEVLRLVAENDKLRELVREIWKSCPVSEDDCAKCSHHMAEYDDEWCDIPILMEQLGVLEVDG